MAEEEIAVEPAEPEPWRLRVTVRCVSNLPSALATSVQVRGFGTDVTSQPSEASTEPAGWIFGEPDAETGDLEVTLPWTIDSCSLLLRERLTLVLLDAGKSAPIAELPLDLRALIHEQLELDGEVVVPLTEEYAALWEVERNEEDENAAPAPENKDTLLSWKVSAESLLGPEADRAGAWTALELEVQSLEGLPAPMFLGTAGPPNPADAENHSFSYGLSMLGMSWSDGALTRTDEDPEAGEDAPPVNASITWPDAAKVAYRGTTFLERFRMMLDQTGGVWLKLVAESKGGGAAAPAKGAAAGPTQEELDAAIEKLNARIFVDLRGFLAPGVTSVDVAARIDKQEPPPPLPEDAEEGAEDPLADFTLAKPYAAAGSQVRVRISLRDPIVPAIENQPAEITIADLIEGADQENVMPLKGGALEAASQLDGALQSAIKVIGGAGQAAGTKESLLLHLKETGAYGILVEELRDALASVARERVRVDRKAQPPAAAAGGVLTDDVCRRVLAELYVVAQDNAIALVEAKEPVVPMQPGTEVESRAVDVLRAASSTAHTAATIAYELEVLLNGPLAPGASGGPDAIPSRAAECWQTQLCQVQGRSSIEVWRGYARFCARVGRKEAAEEALQHMIYSTAKADGTKEVDAAHPAVLKRFLSGFPAGQKSEACDVVLNYAMLLLDRGRFAETNRAVRSVLDADRCDPMHNLSMALLLWLRHQAKQGEADDLENSGKFVSLARKPLDFFKGLTQATDKQLFDKLRLFDRDEVSDSEEEKRAPTLVIVPPTDELPGCRFARLLIEYGSPQLAIEMLAAQPPDGYPPFSALTANTKVACPLVSHLRARSFMRLRDWPKARLMTKELVYAKFIDDEGQHHASPQLWGDYAECLYWLSEDPAAAAQKAQDVVESLLPPEFAEPPSPVPGYRAGVGLMARGQYRDAQQPLLASIRVHPTAIAWYAVGTAAYRTEDNATAFEALTEAMVRNNEHPESWAMLCLWHIRMQNVDLAKFAFTTMMGKPSTPDLDLVLEVGWAMLDTFVSFSFAAARRALGLRDEGHAHWLLGEAWAHDENPSQGVLEMAIAIGMLWNDPDTRNKVRERALALCDDMMDAPLRESVLFAQRKADDKLNAFLEEEERQRRRASAKKEEEANA